MTVDERTDDELVMAARAGDPDAAELTVRRYARRLTAFLYRLTGSVHDSEDLMQDTFARFFASIAGYRPEGRLQAYLFRIASNLAANHAAKRKGAELDHDVADRAPGPAELAEGRDAARALRDALLELPREQREALVLRTHQELSYEEIARIQDASVSAVKVRVFRAREALKAQVRA